MNPMGSHDKVARESCGPSVTSFRVWFEFGQLLVCGVWSLRLHAFQCSHVSAGCTPDAAAPLCSNIWLATTTKFVQMWIHVGPHVAKQISSHVFVLWCAGKGNTGIQSPKRETMAVIGPWSESVFPWLHAENIKQRALNPYPVVKPLKVFAATASSVCSEIPQHTKRQVGPRWSENRASEPTKTRTNLYLVVIHKYIYTWKENGNDLLCVVLRCCFVLDLVLLGYENTMQHCKQ